MAYARLYEQIAGDDKLKMLSNAAWRMWNMGLIYCRKNLTDGFIKAGAIFLWGVREEKGKRIPKIADELCRPQVPGKAALWDKVEGGYQVHDYLQWNDSKQTVLRLRDETRKRVSKWRSGNAVHEELQHAYTVVRSNVQVLERSELEEISKGANGRGGSVLVGALPREHLKHAACDPTFSRCVPNAVHSKLVNHLAPKYGGDRALAGAALQAWYLTVWQSLEASFVMPDEFKFWQARFDLELSSGVPQTGSKPSATCTISVPNAEETAAYLRRQREGA